MPLWPYCFQVRVEGISVLEAVPIAVIDFAEGRRHRLAGQSLQLGLGIEEIDVAGTAFHEEPDDGFRRGRMVGLLRRERDRGRSAPCSIAETASAPSPPQDRIRNSRRYASRWVFFGIHGLNSGRRIRWS